MSKISPDGVYPLSLNKALSNFLSFKTSLNKILVVNELTNTVLK